MDALTLVLIQSMLDSDTPAVRDAALTACEHATYATYADPPILEIANGADYVLVSRSDYGASRYYKAAE